MTGDSAITEESVLSTENVVKLISNFTVSKNGPQLHFQIMFGTENLQRVSNV